MLSSLPCRDFAVDVQSRFSVLLPPLIWRRKCDITHLRGEAIFLCTSLIPHALALLGPSTTTHSKNFRTAHFTSTVSANAAARVRGQQ